MTWARKAAIPIVMLMGASAAILLTGFLSVAIQKQVAFVYFVGDQYACNNCGRSMRKFAQDKSTQYELQCPWCGSRPRHRTAYIYFREHSDLFDGRPKRMLHIAPDRSLAPIFRSMPSIDYLSGDLDPKAAMVQMDITDIHFPDNTFDVIYCSHVLEHVPADRKAMQEMARVLKPTGWAVLAVPIIRQKTFEDDSVKSQEDRTRLFGQWDHVRAYGPDFVDRLRECGFDVTVDRFAEALDENLVRKFGLSRENIYVCRKRPKA